MIKKTGIRLMIVLCVIILGTAAWFYGYYNHKSLDNIPSRELMLTYLEEKGEGYATEKLAGYTVENVVDIWGEPDAELFGMRGLIWEIEEKGILVYFDRENRVTEVKLDAESEAEVEAEKAEEEEHWDRIPMVLIEGVLYVDTGIGVMGDGFEVEDGEPVKALDGTVTSSVEGWEIPTENDQSNFGTGYGYLRGTEEGTVILFMNEKWFLFATEEKKQELLFPELMNQE